jgi:SAM-dependent MidA family methyltransferase
VSLRPWRDAWQEAVYGADGFYRRVRPAAHFRTSVHASLLFAVAVRRLAAEVDGALGHPEVFDVVDVGSGSGELLVALHRLGTDPRWRLTGVDVVDRPAGLPAEVRWSPEAPACRGLLIANEWLDDVPLDVVELGASGPRLVLVDERGRESPGPAPASADLAWVRRWWPLAQPGDRAEVGRPRDEAWAGAVGRLDRGLAVALDYGHLLDRRPAGGTLTGYRQGRAVPPVPDGGCNITAAVAMDPLLRPGAQLLTQREALGRLGVHGTRPPVDLARTDPTAYLHRLRIAGEAAELLDPDGLGGLCWLEQPVGTLAS